MTKYEFCKVLFMLYLVATMIAFTVEYRRERNLERMAKQNFLSTQHGIDVPAEHARYFKIGVQAWEVQLSDMTILQ